MSIKTNIPNTLFRINSKRECFVVKNAVWIKKGDPLYFEKINDIIYITNVITNSNIVNAIAIVDGEPLSSIPCYVIQY